MKNQSLNILLADDESSIREVVQRILENLGHTVEATENGEQAIAAFDRHPDSFQIVMTDHSMPKVNGLGLVSHLRSKNFQGKIIVMSGSLTEELSEEYKSKRVDKILVKPFAMKGLSVEMADLLSDGGVV